LAELFGNAYIEKCLSCKKLFQRKVVCPPTGRFCEDCGGKLIKTGVRYGQETPKKPLKDGTKHAEKADLAIVLGSSMQTSPFNQLPLLAKKMVLCNLGATPYDSAATLKLDASCDELMRYLMKGLGMTIGKFVYSQQYELGYQLISDENYKLFVRGHRKNEPCTCVAQVEVIHNGLTKEMYQSNLNKNYELELRAHSGQALKLLIYFREEYEVAKKEVDVKLEKDETIVMEFSKELEYD